VTVAGFFPSRMTVAGVTDRSDESAPLLLSIDDDATCVLNFSASAKVVWAQLISASAPLWLILYANRHRKCFTFAWTFQFPQPLPDSLLIFIAT